MERLVGHGRKDLGGGTLYLDRLGEEEARRSFTHIMVSRALLVPVGMVLLVVRAQAWDYEACTQNWDCMGEFQYCKHDAWSNGGWTSRCAPAQCKLPTMAGYRACGPAEECVVPCATIKGPTTSTCRPQKDAYTNATALLAWFANHPGRLDTFARHITRDADGNCNGIDPAALAADLASVS